MGMGGTGPQWEKRLVIPAIGEMASWSLEARMTFELRQRETEASAWRQLAQRERKKREALEARVAELEQELARMREGVTDETLDETLIDVAAVV